MLEAIFMQITLKTNGKINPISVGGKQIRLSVETDGLIIDNGILYEIFSSKKELDCGTPFISEVTDERSVYFTRENFFDESEYFWRVTIKDSNGEKLIKTSSFRTGISSENFTAKWIENPLFDGRVSEFNKSFLVDSEVKEAYLYIVGLGFSDAYVNGKKTDDEYFKPLLSDFDKRTGLNNPHYNEENFGGSQKTVYYDTYSVKSMLKKGENNISITVGTGWYCNEDKNITDPNYSYSTPKLIFELRIETCDGKIKVVSDEETLVRNTNIKSQMFACDFIDFTAKENDYVSAKTCTPPSGELLPNPAENDKVIEKIQPLSIAKKSDRFIEYDFGKNHTGGLYLKVKGNKGSKLIINYYENKKDGQLNPITSRWLAYKDGLEIIGYLDQKSEYILSGSEDTIIPYYHWSCYRFATVECDDEFEVIELESLFISTDVKRDGEFYCADEFLTRFNDAFVLTQRDNMHCGIPSDCPTREKLPYTGDGQLVAETVMYSLDTENFYRKWLKDIIDSQGKNGFISNTAPIIAGGGGFWWSNALVVVSSVLYNYTGDKQVFRDAFESAKKLVKFYDSIHNGDYVMRKSYIKWFLGDWCTPDKTIIDIPFVNTLAAYDATDKLLRMYEVLGEEEGKEYFVSFKENLKNAINKFYFNEKTLDYADGVQGANLMPILNGVASDEVAEKLLDIVVKKYQENPHFDTGIIMTPVLLEALSKAGREDLGYKLLTEKTAPSFYDMMEGETTLVEFWIKHDDSKSTISHCHPMFGAVLAWVYKNLAGLDLSRLYDKQIIVAPKLIKQVKSSTISKFTPYGKAIVEYSAEKEFVMNLVVPLGVTANVILPSYINEITIGREKMKNSFTLAGGNYEIVAKII